MSREEDMHRRAQLAEGALKAALGVLDSWLPHMKQMPQESFIIRAIKADVERAVAKARAALAEKEGMR